MATVAATVRTAASLAQLDARLSQSRNQGIPVKYVALAASLGGGGALIGLGGVMMLQDITFGIITYIDPFIIASMVGLAPYGFYVNNEAKKIKEIEEKLPEFLRDIAESGRFGMTLAASIQAAAQGRYGPLTPEIKKMAAQISWGVSAVEALRLFQERRKTPLIERVVGVVIKAASAGGNVSDVLTLVSNDLREHQLDAEDRNVTMVTYLVVIYIAFMVFLATVLILNAVFIPQIEQFVKAGQEAAATSTASGGAAAATGGAVGGPVMTSADVDQIRFIYLAAAIVHGIGDGFVVGILIKGRISAGMIHSVILVLTGYVALRFLVLFV